MRLPEGHRATADFATIAMMLTHCVPRGRDRWVNCGVEALFLATRIPWCTGWQIQCKRVREWVLASAPVRIRFSKDQKCLMKEAFGPYEANWVPIKWGDACHMCEGDDPVRESLQEAIENKCLHGTAPKKPDGPQINYLHTPFNWLISLLQVRSGHSWPLENYEILRACLTFALGIYDPQHLHRCAFMLLMMEEGLIMPAKSTVDGLYRLWHQHKPYQFAIHFKPDDYPSSLNDWAELMQETTLNPLLLFKVPKLFEVNDLVCVDLTRVGYPACRTNAVQPEVCEFDKWLAGTRNIVQRVVAIISKVLQPQYTLNAIVPCYEIMYFLDNDAYKQEVRQEDLVALTDQFKLQSYVSITTYQKYKRLTLGAFRADVLCTHPDNLIATSTTNPMYWQLWEEMHRMYYFTT